MKTFNEAKTFLEQYGYRFFKNETKDAPKEYIVDYPNDHDEPISESEIIKLANKVKTTNCVCYAD